MLGLDNVILNNIFYICNEFRIKYTIEFAYKNYKFSMKVC